MNDEPLVSSEQPTTASPTVRSIADTYVDALVETDPVRAINLGLAVPHDRLTDYSPDGIEARAALDRRTLEHLAATIPANDRERVAHEFMVERLTSALELADGGEHLRALRNIASPVQDLRRAFDLLPAADDHDLERLANRLHEVAGSVGSLQRSLQVGLDEGIDAAPRQAAVVAQQCQVWAGQRHDVAFFVRLIERHVEGREVDASLHRRLMRSAEAATGAYRDFGAWLADSYVSRSMAGDAVGEQRYGCWARAMLGAEVDLAEAYAWAWDDFGRIEAEMTTDAHQVLAAASIDEAIHHLDHDSDLVVHGQEALRRWLQEVMDDAVDALDGVHFTIPTPIRHVEAMLAPPGGAAARYYTPPSHDLSRPGRTWYPAGDRTRFPLWSELSVAYHEGVPGHHLQLGRLRVEAERLNRFQQSIVVTAHSEGWALYAERLMGELGFLDDPAFRLGMLQAQALRAARVIVDIGMHLERRVPRTGRFHPGERWTPELAEEFLVERARATPSFATSEVVRYLGWPAQAITYKLGERAWLAARADARRRAGATFDLRHFHETALLLGPVGLDQLGVELAAAGLSHGVGSVEP